MTIKNVATAPARSKRAKPSGNGATPVTTADLRAKVDELVKLAETQWRDNPAPVPPAPAIVRDPEAVYQRLAKLSDTLRRASAVADVASQAVGRAEDWVACESTATVLDDLSAKLSDVAEDVVEIAIDLESAEHRAREVKP